MRERIRVDDVRRTMRGCRAARRRRSRAPCARAARFDRRSPDGISIRGVSCSIASQPRRQQTTPVSGARLRVGREAASRQSRGMACASRGSTRACSAARPAPRRAQDRRSTATLLSGWHPMTASPSRPDRTTRPPPARTRRTVSSPTPCSAYGVTHAASGSRVLLVSSTPTISLRDADLALDLGDEAPLVTFGRLQRRVRDECESPGAGTSPRLISRSAMQTTDDESSPPLSSAQTVPSVSSRARTASRHSARSCSSYVPGIADSGCRRRRDVQNRRARHAAGGGDATRRRRAERRARLRTASRPVDRRRLMNPAANRSLRSLARARCARRARQGRSTTRRSRRRRSR